RRVVAAWCNSASTRPWTRHSSASWDRSKMSVLPSSWPYGAHLVGWVESSRPTDAIPDGTVGLEDSTHPTRCEGTSHGHSGLYCGHAPEPAKSARRNTLTVSLLSHIR